MSDPEDRPGAAFFAALKLPAGLQSMPAFDRGWRGDDGTTLSHLTYFNFAGGAWSDDLEELHEESSREHFIDVLTRDRLIEAITPGLAADSVIADLGCSTGYLLEDLARCFPRAQLIGVDVVASGLRKAHRSVPQAALLLADVCDLPMGDASVDAVVSANMLEHVANDGAALREIYRVLKPGGVAAFVVPSGASLYDYYDRFLGHERRYGKGELAAKALSAGFIVRKTSHVGQLLYPPFWAVKKRNRLQYDGLQGKELEAKVEADIAATSNSRLGAFITRLERKLVDRGLELPFGIRELAVLQRGAPA